MRASFNFYQLCTVWVPRGGQPQTAGKWQTHTVLKPKLGSWKERPGEISYPVTQTPVFLWFYKSEFHLSGTDTD